VHTFILLNSVKLFDLRVQSLPDLLCTLKTYIHLHRFTRLLLKKCQLLNTQHLINKTATNIRINKYIIHSMLREELVVCKKIT